MTFASLIEAIPKVRKNAYTCDEGSTIQYNGIGLNQFSERPVVKLVSVEYTFPTEGASANVKATWELKGAPETLTTLNLQIR